jgi:threonyl-tRNA synthetase
MESDVKKLELLRHSTAHVLAAAVLEMFPEAKFGIGPAIENGFYYDFSLPRTLIPEDLPILEEKMKEIIATNHQFDKAEISIDEAFEKFSDLKQTFKLELIEDLKEAGNDKVTIYKSGHFVDLCSGPHIGSTRNIDANAFALTKISGAYWKGDAQKQQMQRIYGVVFENKKSLKQYIQQQEEAAKRDHRKLGKELDLFIFSELVGPGLPIYTHRGATVRKEIIKYCNELQGAIGYKEVHTPNMNKAELFKVSGHYEKFKEDMFKVTSNYTEEEYFLKPMNCPQHTQIFASKMRSYKDLPIRIADFANLYRDEKPGELSGLTRLRCFCQDDGHCFCREDQIKNEFSAVLDAIKKAMQTYSMEYTIRLSLWDPKNSEKYLGEPAVWEKSQKLLEEILIENKIEYTVGVGEAAMYGPKMDLISRDSLGREWQLSTIQLDFIMPVRFGLEYIDAEGKKRTPVMVHRAITGSPERLMGILIEHYAGAFPLWLSPVQVVIIPVSEKFSDYANQTYLSLLTAGVRAEIDERSESLGKRISEAEKMKVPNIIVVGQREVDEKNITVRTRGIKEQTVFSLEEFAKKINKEIIDRI